MSMAYDLVFYTLAFLSVYVQVFFLFTFLEKRKYIVKNPDILKLASYPSVTITIPCYNEERTIEATVKSLLALDYPKDKFNIFIVDDGSTDNTWSVLQGFKDTQGIQIFHKENGGKHTCLNLGLEHCKTEFFGCLDSDSFVHPQALVRIMNVFAHDEYTMAVAPSIIVLDPKNILQNAQKVEYDMAVYIKKMLGFVGGIHVTPGPFSIFRKKVFDDLGNYRKAHNTEDQEIALRMQEHGYKIDHCPDAYVYTITPNTVMKLYRQRLRWIYGFIKNLIDYRRLIFRRKYGALAFFTLPSGIISIFGTCFMFGTIIYNISNFLYNKFIQFQVAGISYTNDFKFDWFYLNTKAMLFISIILYLLVITSVMIGRYMAEKKASFSITILYFVVIYSIIAPFWLLKAVYNAILSKESSWTFERRATVTQ